MPLPHYNGTGQSTGLTLGLTHQGRNYTFLQKQDIDDSYVFSDYLMEGGMKGHGHSSIFCHHVNHTPGLKSKARDRPGLGRQDWLIHQAQCLWLKTFLGTHKNALIAFKIRGRKNKHLGKKYILILLLLLIFIPTLSINIILDFCV